MPTRRPSRTKAGVRCQRCFMRVSLCVCNHVPLLKTDVRLVLLIHSHEIKSTTNTGKLAAYAFPQSDIRVRGRRDQPMNGEGLVPPGHHPLFLYPSPDAVELTPQFVQGLSRPISLIVPDGTWRQASKVARRVPELSSVTRVKLPIGEPSAYRLRISPAAHRVSTIEAIARAMGILESAEAQAQLERLFGLVVARTLWSRGVLKISECREFIPEAALRERYEQSMNQTGQLSP